MKDRPRMGAEGAAEAARRQERLAAALRDNLKKRKEQLRQRQSADEAPGATRPAAGQKPG